MQANLVIRSTPGQIGVDPAVRSDSPWAHQQCKPWAFSISKRKERKLHPPCTARDRCVIPMTGILPFPRGMARRFPGLRAKSLGIKGRSGDQPCLEELFSTSLMDVHISSWPGSLNSHPNTTAIKGFHCHLYSRSYIRKSAHKTNFVKRKQHAKATVGPAAVNSVMCQPHFISPSNLHTIAGLI